jgi:hypothetical protein
MTTMPIRRTARQPRRESPTHLFAIGQAVQLKRGIASAAPSGDIYLVTGTLPPRGDSLQYRIRNEAERHERVMTQDSLELAGVAHSGDGATLIERTFGPGEGTEAQHSPDQKAEAGADSVPA